MVFVRRNGEQKDHPRIRIHGTDKNHIYMIHEWFIFICCDFMPKSRCFQDIWSASFQVVKMGFSESFLGITLPETDSKFAPGNGWKTIVPFGARRLYVQVCLVLVSGRVYSWILHIILGGFSGHKFQTLGVLENSGTYLDVPGLEVRINGERINGLFHLLTNGVFLGVITYNL